jgi:transglycosylase-like protein with SLT domain
MAIDFGSLSMRLNPLSAINPGQLGQMGMERQRLQLMREQFEETKQRNDEDAELRRQAEAGAMARQKLQLQQQREKAEADRVAALTTEKRKAMDAFSKFRESGDIEGMEAAIPHMTALGMGVERLGEDEGGLPAYQIDQDAAEALHDEDARTAQAAPYDPEGEAGPSGGSETAAQSLSRLGALGYPTNERGNLDDGSVGRTSSTEDAFDQAQAAMLHADTEGQPLRGPDPADLMGAVPKNVIDMGAINAQAARRLDPALGALQSAYPDAMQPSVAATNEAASSLALPAGKAMDLAKDLRAGPDAAIARQDAAEQAALGREATATNAMAKGDRADYKEAYRQAAAVAKDRGIGDVYHAQKSGQMVIDLLSDKDGNNDLEIAFVLPNMLGSIGAQSNKDLAVALGLDSMSTVDQVKERIVNIVKGGFSDMRKETLIDTVKKSLEIDDERVFGMLDTIDEQLGRDDLTPAQRKAWLDYKKTIPKDYRDAHDEDKGETGDDGGDEEAAPPAERRGTTALERPERQPTGGIDDDEEFQDALDSEATENDLDPDTIRHMIGGESGGDPSVQNKRGSSARGLIQFLDSTAKQYGFKDSKEFAQLSRTEQVPYIVKYLKDKGLDADSPPEDYALAIAAPGYVGKSDDTVIREYKAGTKYGDLVREQNPSWIPADGGDITVGSIVASYGLGKGGKKKPTAQKKREPEPDEPETDEEAGDEDEGSELDSEVLGILKD